MPSKKGKLKDVALRMVKDSRAYCVISIDGADNVKVAGDVAKLGEPQTLAQEVFARAVMYMHSGAQVLASEETKIMEEQKQANRVAGMKAKRSKESLKEADNG